MASGFAELPSHKINYDVGRFAVAPAPPVIPTAEMAAQLAKTISTVAENLSPEQRRLKETELAILGNKLIAGRQEQELRQIQIQQAKQGMADSRASLQNRKDAFHRDSGNTTNSSATGIGPEPPPSIPHTHPSYLTPMAYQPTDQSGESSQSDMPNPSEYETNETTIE